MEDDREVSDIEQDIYKWKPLSHDLSDLRMRDGAAEVLSPCVAGAGVAQVMRARSAHA